ncbi:MAG TPA: HEAT repeat domain-containing protein, partial [Clostridia bacterium]|nr:HEAT repeat domain-containing protein [Clostridia bacterium]
MQGPSFRLATVRSLGFIGSAAREAVPVLAGLLDDKDVDLCWETAKTLSLIGEESIPYLIPFLRHSDPIVRQAAAYALGQIGPHAEEAVPALIQALGDSHLVVRDTTVGSLVNIGPPAVPALLRAVDEQRGNIQRGAAKCLAKLAFTRRA